MPFWVSAILALFCIVFFSKFFEAPILFLLSDLLYGAKEEKFYNMVFISFIIITIVLLTIEALKNKIKFYPNIK